MQHINVQLYFSHVHTFLIPFKLISSRNFSFVITLKDADISRNKTNENEIRSLEIVIELLKCNQRSGATESIPL